MGTSSSSSGSPSGGPITPPWVPPPPSGPLPSRAPEAGDGAEDGNDSPKDGQAAPTGPSSAPTSSPINPIAPRGRFGSARTSLGKFARSGSTDDMRQGIGRYVHQGLQGSRSGVHRFGGTATSAGSLFGALSGFASGQTKPGGTINRFVLQGRTAQEVMAAIVEAVKPIDGTQDGEATRDSISRALTETLNQFPTADLLDLTLDQRLFAIERFLARDVFHRVCLDLGKHLQNSAVSVDAALKRFSEIRDYIRETIAAAFRNLRGTSNNLTAANVAALARECLRETLHVFEGYA
jgi:hypothetical protein